MSDGKGIRRWRNLKVWRFMPRQVRPRSQVSQLRHSPQESLAGLADLYAPYGREQERDGDFRHRVTLKVRLFMGVCAQREERVNREVCRIHIVHIFPRAHSHQTQLPLEC